MPLVRRGHLLTKVWFSCVYCGQDCFSYAILCSHESTCEKRKAFTRSYDDARRKHTGRLRRGTDWNTA